MWLIKKFLNIYFSLALFKCIVEFPFYRPERKKKSAYNNFRMLFFVGNLCSNDTFHSKDFLSWQRRAEVREGGEVASRQNLKCEIHNFRNQNSLLNAWPQKCWKKTAKNVERHKENEWEREREKAIVSNVSFLWWSFNRCAIFWFSQEKMKKTKRKTTHAN